MVARSAKKEFKKHSLFVRKSYTKRGTLSSTPSSQAEEWLEIPLDKSFILMLSRYRKRKALTMSLATESNTLYNITYNLLLCYNNTTLQNYIGCPGWSYSAWQGLFYTSNIENFQWLSYNSKVFDFVEIDSTFYRMPNPFVVKNWYRKTPDKENSRQL